MSDRRATLAYATFESKDWQAAAEHAEAAFQGGYRPAQQLGAFIAYQRRDYAAAIAAFEAAADGLGEGALATLIRLHLLAGDAQRGWQLLLDCCRSNAFGPPLYSLPRWRGEPLEGRRIAPWGTSYGDDLLFARFLPKLADTGAVVFLHCRERLVRVFRTLRGVADVFPLETEVTDADFHLHLAELPALFEAY